MEYSIQRRNSLGLFRVFHIHHHAYIKKARMAETGYPTEPKGNYFCYVFDEEVTLGTLDIHKLISEERIGNHEYVDGAPIFRNGAEMMKYRK